MIILIYGKRLPYTVLVREADNDTLNKNLVEFAGEFGYDADEILKQGFVKLFPRWLRPYGRLYA